MMSETSKRVLMGIVMAVIVIAAIIYLPQLYFSIAVAAVVLFTGYEWVGLITENKMAQGCYLLALLVCLVAVHVLSHVVYVPIIVLAASLLAIIVGIVQLFVFAANPSNALVQNKFLRVVLSLLILASAQYFISTLRWHGNFWIVYVIALVAMFDTGAYFSGRAFGKTPLAKKLSPKKTWGGFFGGCGLGLVFSIAMLCIMQTQYPATIAIWIFMVVMTVFMAAISVFGDLFESMQKRIAGKKDSSNLIPGHGGFFDRIDALLFVLPLMFIYREMLVFLMNRSVLQHTLILMNHMH
jgi:phosphatidate cytidylyltransferase